MYIYIYIYIFYIYIYAIMKTMCPPDYHHNGLVATHALGHMMYSYHCGDNQEVILFSWLHIYIYTFKYTSYNVYLWMCE